jgi:hypothetical protein
MFSLQSHTHAYITYFVFPFFSAHFFYFLAASGEILSDAEQQERKRGGAE